MAQVGTLDSVSNTSLYTNVATTSSGAVAIQTLDVTRYDTFQLMSLGGAVQVQTTLDGSNFSTAPLAMTDLGSTASTPVILTSSGRMYGFRGKYRGVQITQQSSVTLSTSQVSLICGKMGG
jgi:hypothetical protein